MGAKMSVQLDITDLKKLKKRLKSLDKRSVDWGFLDGYHSTANMTYAALANILEYGIPGKIPSRPAFSAYINKLESSWKQYELATQKSYSDFVTGVTQTPEAILKISGQHLTSRHQSTMEYWIMGGTMNKHNADLTVDLKGFDQPFVDTGELVESVDYRIN